MIFSDDFNLGVFSVFMRLSLNFSCLKPSQMFSLNSRSLGRNKQRLKSDFKSSVKINVVRIGLGPAQAAVAQTGADQSAKLHDGMTA
jgi:hypothetical protein